MSNHLPELSDAEARVFEKLAAFDMARLKEWTKNLEEARRQVDHWTKAADASSAVAIRISIVRKKA